VKIKLLLIFFIFGISTLYSAPRIDEANIPMPETQYELPDNLIGNFIFISSWAERGIQIFPNNKFITWQAGHDHPVVEHYGYVIKRNASWYLMPILGHPYAHPFLYEMTEVTLTDNGFSFLVKNDMPNERNIAIPEIKITEETMIAEEISIPRIKAIQQYYFYYEQSNTRQIIDYAEIPYSDYFHPLFYSLNVTNGRVDLVRHYNRDNGTIGGYGPSWKGFIEIAYIAENNMRGIIRFTNGVPFYYTNDGTALLEIDGDNIIITIRCSVVEEERIRIKFPNFQTPIYLRLEFKLNHDLIDPRVWVNG